MKPRTSVFSHLRSFGRSRWFWASAAVSAVALSSCFQEDEADAVDEYRAAGKTFKDLPPHQGDAFQGMDSHAGADLTQEEIQGRNDWLMWTGGNQAFWDYLARHGNGIVDLLKILDNGFLPREDRFGIMGIIPTPGMTEVTMTNEERLDARLDPKRHYGLALDDEGSDTYPDGEVPDPAVYGHSTGIVGLRLFPNPAFEDPKAQEAWDPVAYIEDEAYYKNPTLVRPYRVGMACAFCHVSTNPVNPPQLVHEAEWENLSGTIGSQYFWIGRIFAYDLKSDNLLFHLLDSPVPGSLDTSLLATDGINNPNTMNAVFNLQERILTSLRVEREKQGENTLAGMPTIDSTHDIDGDGEIDVEAIDLGTPVEADGARHTPHVLFGGADSIGVRGAVCRVYVNIGEFHQEWIKHHHLMIGLDPQSPFPLAKAAANSAYWNATMVRSTNIAHYLIRASKPMRLADALRGGSQAGETQAYAADRGESPTDEIPAAEEASSDEAVAASPPAEAAVAEAPPAETETSAPSSQVQRGQEVFAENCMVCHSSKQPEGFWEAPTDWHRWSRDSDYQDWALSEVGKPDFLEDNYLSTDQRYPITEIGTNVKRSVADNGKAGRIWAEFTSESFKNQETLDATLQLADPYEEGKTREWVLDDQVGPGRVRAPSLISMWATAPFFHNNSLGYYPYAYKDDPRPGREGQVSYFPDEIQTVEGRLAVFDDAARQLLGLKERAGYASIYRLPEDSSIVLPKVLLPSVAEMLTARMFGRPISITTIRVALFVIVAALAALVVFLYIRARRKPGVQKKHIAGIVVGALVLWGILHAWTFFKQDQLHIGNIPEGTPIDLLLNINGPEWVSSSPERRKLLVHAIIGLKKARKQEVESLEEIDGLVDALFELSKCPDMVLDRGHAFGEYATANVAAFQAGDAEDMGEPLSEEDRLALLEYLKTL